MHMRFRNRGSGGDGCAPNHNFSGKGTPGFAFWGALLGLIGDAIVRDLKKPDSRLRELVGRLHAKIVTTKRAPEIGMFEAKEVRLLDKRNKLMSLEK